MATMTNPAFSPSPTNPAYKAWASRYRKNYGKAPVRSNITAWKTDWMRRGGATPPTSLGLQQPNLMPDYMSGMYRGYRNLNWEDPSQDIMNRWTNQFWQGQAKRPWTSTLGGGAMDVSGATKPVGASNVVNREKLAWGRQYRPWTFY